MAVATAAWAQKMNLCSVFPSPLPCTICHGSLSYCHLTWVLILHSGDVLVVILLSLTNLSQTFPPICLQGCSVHWSEWSLTDTGSRSSPWCWAANSGLDHARMVTAAAGSRAVRERCRESAERCSCHIQGIVYSRCWLALTTSHEHGDVFVGSCAVSWVWCTYHHCQVCEPLD